MNRAGVMGTGCQAQSSWPFCRGRWEHSGTDTEAVAADNQLMIPTVLCLSVLLRGDGIYAYGLNPWTFFFSLLGCSASSAASFLFTNG